MTKRRYKNKIVTVRREEKPTPERYLHNGGVIAEVIDRDSRDKILMQRHKAVVECPLDAYFQRQAITAAQYRAGIKFRYVYLRAVLRVRVDDIGSGCRGSFEMSALMPIHSERILHKAYATLSPAQKILIINVCGHDEWAGGFYKLKTLYRGLQKLSDLWSPP